MQSNTENFLIWCFQKILQDKEIKRAQNQDLKKCCQTLLNELREKIVENGTSSVLPAVKSDGDNIMSNSKYFEPFELALTSKSQTIVVVALDCLQKLIAYGHISNIARYKNSKDERLIEKIVSYICECFQNGQASDSVQLQIIKAILTIISNNELEIHENHLINLVRSCYSIYIACKDPVIQHTAKGTLTQMLNTIFNKMEAKTIELCSQTTEELEVLTETVEEDDELTHSNCESSKDVADEIIDGILDKVTNSSQEGEEEPQQEKTTKNFAHIYQKDAFLVFRCLCRLSLKPLPDNNSNTDKKSHDLLSKILSLELLLNILQNCGPVFKQNEIFINAIKQYLCVALSKNGVSSVSEVFELSLSIFLSLLSNFKQHLKRQNEVFFKEIFLYILESPRSSFNHKDLVLEALKRICVNAQCVVDIYLNYDCDLTLANIFERLVNDIAKIAQGRQTGDSSTNGQSRILRIKAFDCLYNILNCMVEWSNELYVNPESQSFFGTEQERHEGTIGTGIAPRIDTNSNSKYGLKSVDSSNSVNSQASSQSSLIPGSNSNINLNAVQTQDNPEHFASRKQQKELFEQGISLFNKKPLKGLNFLQEQGLLGTSVDDVAEFLHKDERLNKTVVGDFLGENDRYNIEVMYAFVDQFDFAGKEFVASLREFLAGFRMPGEAQKIDRLMEKFASRYCECNSTNNVFKSADAAYVLAYSIIMLTTDLHSSQIKNRNRMRKEDYIKMNRGINESDDLDVDYLGGIYDEIAGNEIKMKDSVQMVDRSRHTNQMADGKMSSGAMEKQRQLLFNMEVEEMARAAKELMESISHIESDFTSATHQEHVKPMFRLVWTPFMAAFSVGLQDCDDQEISRFCLDGIRCAIRIACIFNMELERNAYIQALSRFTLLITGASGAGGIKSKNIDTIKTLIQIAHSDGNYLGSSWLEILRCISQLESAQLIGENSLPQILTKKITKYSPESAARRQFSLGHMSNGGSEAHSSSDQPLNLNMLMSDSHKHNFSVLQEVMGETGSQSLIVAVDKVFTGSVRLDGDAIVEFVKALCQVSRDELSLAQPRIFSLQKLVEISYYNMGRIRLQWSRVWTIIGEHFTNAGRSTNENVAIFAIDSLRQLAVKFIEKGEFPNFHFQKDFLRPFVNIIDRSQPHLSRNVEDMVVRCVAQLVQSHWANIRSGWSNVFLVFLNASLPITTSSSNKAQQRTLVTQQESIVEMAFESLSFVVKEVFQSSFHLIVDSFHMLVKSLAEFACNTNYPDINMEAIRLIRQCARYVDEQSAIFKEITNTAAGSTSLETESFATTSYSFSNQSEPLDDEDKTWVRGWMPVLGELFRIINCCKLDVRTRALTVLFEILKSYGLKFRNKWWRDTFNLVFGVFDAMPMQQPVGSATNTPESIVNTTGVLILHQHSNSVRIQPHYSDRSEWLNTTCNHTLYAVIDVFSQYYLQLHSIMLDDLFAKLQWCCLQDFEQLARSGTSCIETVIISNGQKFHNKEWVKAVNLLEQVFEQTTPSQLLHWKPNNNSANSRDRKLSNDSSTSTPGQTPSIQTNVVSNSETRLHTFATLLVRCVVQFELVQAVNNIVFYPASTRKEDELLWKQATLIAISGGCNSNNNCTEDSQEHDNPPDTTNRRQSESSTSLQDYSVYNDEKMNQLNNNGIQSQWDSDIPKDGLYNYMSPDQLLQLTECLVKSHEFAKTFNCDHEQRNLLWKAGFKGKAKPNLMKQETHSLSLALRILFKLLEDSRLSSDECQKVEQRLLQLVNTSLVYYRDNLTTENHRQSWNTILCLILSKLVLPSAGGIIQEPIMSDARFMSFARCLYMPLCDLITIDAPAPSSGQFASGKSPATTTNSAMLSSTTSTTTSPNTINYQLPIQIRALYRSFLVRFGKSVLIQHQP